MIEGATVATSYAPCMFALTQLKVLDEIIDISMVHWLSKRYHVKYYKYLNQSAFVKI